MLDFLETVDKRLTRVLEGVLVALFAVFLVLVLLLVVLRYIFATTIIGGNEFVTIAFLFTSAIGAAVGISRKDHVAITFFIDNLPRSAKKCMYVIGLVLVSVINIAMVYLSINWIELVGQMPWQPLGWPQGIIQSSVPAGCSLAVVYCLIKIVLTLGNRQSMAQLWLPED